MPWGDTKNSYEKLGLRCWRVCVTALLAFGGCGNTLAGSTEKAGVGGRPILTEASIWRWYLRVRPPVVQPQAIRAVGGQADKPVPLPVRLPWNPIGDVENIQTSPPPENWKEVDFDDSDWPRSQGPFQKSLCVGTLYLRGKFVVQDPASVKGMTLSVDYRGGAVVHLNGREVARTHMPAGPLNSDTDADPYPDEAFISVDGKAIPPLQKATDDDKTRMKKRERSIGPMTLSTLPLRKGVNVLAIEVHRSPFHPAALTWWNNPNDYPYGRISHWSPIGLDRIVFSIEGDAVQPNLVRAAEPAVWLADIHERVNLDSFQEPGNVSRPIRIVGARNGVYAGQIVVSSLREFRLRSVLPTDLEGTGIALGKKISADMVQIRYLGEGNPAVNLGDVFDAVLSVTPSGRKPASRTHWQLVRQRRERGWPEPVPGVVQPLWITVAIPAEAAAGEYKGQIRLSSDCFEQPVTVPMEVYVANWTLPNPPDFVTHAGIFQSPTTLSIYYNVPLWSEAHWELMEKSFRLLALVGNKVLNIPVSEQTQFGDDEGIVRFVRNTDGALEPEFSVFERYIQLATKYLKPTVVSIQVWHAGAWQPRRVDQQNTVTVIDPRSGRRVESWQVPVFGTEASARFWKPVLEGTHKRLADAGLEGAMALGILSDGTAPGEVFQMFHTIAPGTGWTRGCHSVTRARQPYNVWGPVKVVYHEFCYGGSIADPGKKFPEWNLTGPGTDWRRGQRDWFPPVSFRRLPERGLYCETRGFGRVGLDYWPVKIEVGGKQQVVEIFNRYPHSSVGGHGDPTVIALAHPSSDGPVPTVRFELLREGIQEAEAVLYIARALEKHATQLGPALVERCRKVFGERIETCRMLEAVDADFYAGWQARSRRLYELAAEIATKLSVRR